MSDVSEAAGQGGSFEGHGLLQRVGQELSGIAAAVAALQAALGPPLEQAARNDPRLIPTMQGFDLIEQLLASLSGLMHSVGEAGCRLDPDAITNALQAIPLADLQRRLRADGAPEPGAGSDEVDLFADDEIWAA